MENLGDADGLVVVADLGLVVPQHRQAAVATDAVQGESDDFAGPAAGIDEGFPDQPDTAVVGVVDLGQDSQVGLVGQRSGDVVGKRAAGPVGLLCTGRGSHDELTGQPDPVGLTDVHSLAQNLADVVGTDAEGGVAGRGGVAATAPDAQRRQPVAGPVALVGDKGVHVLGPQQSRVVAAVGSLNLQPGAQLGARTSRGVVRAVASRRAGPAHLACEVVPQQIPQPPLGDHGQVPEAAAGTYPGAEVVKFDESGVLGVGRTVVDQPQPVADLRDDHPVVERAVLRLHRHQRPDTVGAAAVSEALQPAQRPRGVVRLLPVDEHAVLDLRGQQRGQPDQVEPAGPPDRLSVAAPRPEHRLVLPHPAALGAGSAARAAGGAVPVLLARTQPQRRRRQRRAHAHPALAVTGRRCLASQPGLEVRLVTPALHLRPSVAVPPAQPQPHVPGRRSGQIRHGDGSMFSPSSSGCAPRRNSARLTPARCARVSRPR